MADRTKALSLAALLRGPHSCPGCSRVCWGATALLLHKRECEVIQGEIAEAKAQVARDIAAARAVRHDAEKEVGRV